jgi:DNA-directed RNA polymerase subunit beta'
VDEHGRERERYKVPYGAELSVEDGKPVEAGKEIAKWDPYTHPIITEVAGLSVSPSSRKASPCSGMLTK